MLLDRVVGCFGDCNTIFYFQEVQNSIFEKVLLVHSFVCDQKYDNCMACTLISLERLTKGLKHLKSVELDIVEQPYDPPLLNHILLKITYLRNPSNQRQ